MNTLSRTQWRSPASLSSLLSRSTSSQAGSASGYGLRWYSLRTPRCYSSTNPQLSSTSPTSSTSWNSLRARQPRGRTVAAVVHDLTQACTLRLPPHRMRDGAVVAAGPPGTWSPRTCSVTSSKSKRTSTLIRTGSHTCMPLRTLRTTRQAKTGRSETPLPCSHGADFLADRGRQRAEPARSERVERLRSFRTLLHPRERPGSRRDREHSPSNRATVRPRADVRSQATIASLAEGQHVSHLGTT